MCTSASTAWRATSAGVWNSGPTSTSKPRSAKAVAITFWPRSWPSWPILATRMRGRRPSASSNASTSVAGALHAGRRPGLVSVHTGDRTDLARVPPVHLLQGVGDLADGGLGAGRVHGERQQVALQAAAARAALGRAGQRAQRVLAGGLVALLAQPPQLVDLLGAHRGVVDLEHVDLLVGLDPVLVDADDRLASGVDAGLGAGRGLLDAELGDARVDGLAPCRPPPRPPRCAARRGAPGRG